mgnify:CR=1 FL=1
MVPVKLVFVDDDPDDRDLIRGSLEKIGADNFVVLDSSCALLNFLGPLAEKDLPDTIVLDLNMPEMDGLQILKHLKSTEDYQQIPVYILTTTSRPDVKQQCIREGAAGFYTKPSSIAELETLLNEIYNTV